MKNYKEDLKIDEHDLDRECLRQPVLFNEYTEGLAEAVYQRDTAKLGVDRVYAELDKSIRELAIEESRKTTETMLQNEIASHESYQKAQKEYLQAKKEVADAERIKEAFVQRRDMLKLMCELYISGYWSKVEPSASKKTRLDAMRSGIEEKKRKKKSG